MKNLKKVLALVLAFACAFTMFAGAVVYPDVPAGSEYSEAITMLSDLGIIQGKDDGKYHSEDTITRAEACALIARMLTGDPQVSQYAGASNFTDVVKGSWKESVVGYCVVNGITVGVGNNKFEPDRAITDAEFVTMVVRAMGYETTGTSYPYGHISAAQANGLLDDVTVVPSSAALRGEDAQIIYNALFADYARGAKQINTTHGTTVEEYPTIAEDVFGLTRAAVGDADKDGNLKNCKAHTWVVLDQYKLKDGNSYILADAIEDDETDLYDFGRGVEGAWFEYEGDIDALKGYQVELWGEGQHGEEEYETVELDGVKTKVVALGWEIKAIKTVKGQSAYDYNATMNDDKDNDKIKFEDTEVKVDKAQINNKDEAELNVKNAASYKLIDWDSDDTIDAIVEDRPDYYEVASVTKTKVKLADFDGAVVYTLDLDGSTDIGDDTIKAEMPEDLEEGDILMVTSSDVYDKKSGDRVSTWTVELVEPEAMEVTDVDTKKGVAFDGEYIDVADKDFCFKGYKDEKASKTYDDLDEDTETLWDVWQDANGFIIKLEETDETYSGYIFVTGAENGENRTGNRYLPVISGVNDKNEFMEDVKVTKDADIKGFYNKDTREFATGTNTDPVGLVFKYKMNDDGQITKMEQVAKTGVASYEFVDKTDAFINQANNEKSWADKASVLFAVKVTATEYTSTYNNGIAAGYGANVKDLDEKNVMAVAYDDIPDITTGTTGKTDEKGASYDRETKNDNLKAAVLGVDTFRFFSNTTIKAGLVTKMTYHKSSDTYTLDATVAGLDETEFDTVDADDVYVNGVANKSNVLNTMYNKLTKTNPVYGIYCEIELDKDGKVVALTEMDTKSAATAALGAMTGYQIKTNPSYQAVRAVVNKVTADKSLTVSTAVANGDNKVYTVDNAQYTQAFDLKDSTEFFKITDEKVQLPAAGKTIAVVDGFKKGFGVEEGSADDLDSYIDNADDEDEYVVADVILDGDDVVAVYYYAKAVKENTADVVYSTAVVADATTAFVPFSTKTNGVAQKNTLTFTGAVDVNSLNLTIKALGTEVVVAMANGDDAVQAAIKAEAALKSGLGSKATVDRNNNVVTIAATQAAAHQNILLNGQDLNVTVHGLTVNRAQLQQGKAPTDNAKASATLKIKNAAYKYTSDTTLTISAGVYAAANPNTSVGTQTATVTLKAGVVYTADEIASALASALKTAIGTTWKVEVSATDNVVSIVADSAQVGGVGDMIKLALALA